ncbi:enoyl-CoA hydratase/isomerase family protein [Hazenella sp. IB182357]|uniref:Enoyl-CoA hydratase/isomerase family protein n=1 Tax=Polycladospora coralii TaxID=2771432 RepID=A0A926RUV5_9BACL|nr:enoyl-CoA hydratase-related protein [Polycladospora coralii]MBD1373453.1 enoyl-CoA hydratase/isomerase family protein [Polycladospora coralii]
MKDHFVKFEKQGAVGHIRLNRPDVLNALHSDLIRELADVMDRFDQDEEIRVIILTGNEKAFAAGADIEELRAATPTDFMRNAFFADWGRIRQISKPIIAAVSGFALGGGCELAMCCDLIVASETAKFGQPEINLGVIPGAGGTQRLTRALGEKRALQLILTGEMLSAEEALHAGLINKVVPVDDLAAEANQLALKIAARPPLAVQLAKKAVYKANDLTLEEGLQFEQHAFYLLFATEDQTEGMDAFVEKRKATFQGK